MKNAQIEGLRGYALIMVVVFHYFFHFSQYFGIGETYPILGILGPLGVSIFMVISSWFLVTPVDNNFSYKEFLRNKLKRLWPMFFISTTITFVVSQILPIPGRSKTFIVYLLNLPLLNYVFGTAYIDGAHWYLATLFILIIIMGIAKKYKKVDSPSFYLLWLILLVLSKILNNQLIYQLLGTGYVGFVCTIAAYRNINIFDKEKAFKWFLIALSGVLFVYFNLGLQYVIYMILGMIYLTLCLKNYCPGFESNIFQYLGKISYPYYLIHQNIGYTFIYYMIKLFGSEHLYLFAILAIPVAFVFMKFLIFIYSILFNKKTICGDQK